MTDQIDPPCAALLVMDYQNGIVDMLGAPDQLLARAADAIALARRRGANVGSVRVAFEDADFEAIPDTSRMGARVAASAKAFHNDSPTTAVHDRVRPNPATSSCARRGSARSRPPTSTRNFANATSTP
jgi:nicotinamidase-related amidase